MIKELEDKKQTHMPAYTELIQKRNEVEAAQDIALDQRTYGTSRLESMDMRYIKAKVNILKKHRLPMVHMIVITKVSAGEASEQRDYESWSCALVPMSDDGVWSVDAPCMAHTSAVVLPADSEEYRKFVEMWLGRYSVAIFGSCCPPWGKKRARPISSAWRSGYCNLAQTSLLRKPLHTSSRS